jgi:hypothetical protein
MKPTGALKAYLNAKDGTRVISSVERYLLIRPQDTSRNQLVFHPSHIASDKWCEREQYFLLIGKPKKHRPEGLKTSLTFAVGHEAHARWQNWFKEMGALWGTYFCNDCRTTFNGLPKDHKIDPKHLEYNEFKLSYPPLRIAGSCDGILLNFGDPLLLELKTIGAGSIRWYNRQLWEACNRDFETAWKDIKQPFEAHVMQAQIYMKLAELMELEYAPKQALILYEAKGIHEVKEFVVNKSEFGLTSIFDRVKKVLSAVEAKVPPTCNINGIVGCPDCNYYRDEDPYEQVRD